MLKQADLSELIGKTLSRVEKTCDQEILFKTMEGKLYSLCHKQDCCEEVSIEDVIGDLSDLVGEPILMAEEVSNFEWPPPLPGIGPDTYTWTFYKFATRKGYVDIRWYGVSNGCYSERAEFYRVA